MKLSKKALKWRSNILIMLFSVLVATVMWYMVSVRDQLETQVEVNIDYIGIPPDLVVTSGLITKVVVRLRGSETLIRSIPRNSLHDVINLSGIKKGDTVVPLGTEWLGRDLRAFEIIDIQPPRIIVKADTLAERSIPLHVTIDSPLGHGAVTVENVHITPPTVILRGPESVIAQYTELSVPLRPDPAAATGRPTEVVVPLDTDSLITAVPSTVRVSYTITSGREVVRQVCRIRVSGDNEEDYKVMPPELELLVEVPEALTRNSTYMAQLEAIVAPPALTPGQSVKVPVRIRTPEGMIVINTQAPSEVTVTRLQAPAPAP